MGSASAPVFLLSIVYFFPENIIHNALTSDIQVHRKFFIDSDFSHNYLHTPYMFARLSQEQFLFDV